MKEQQAEETQKNTAISPEAQEDAGKKENTKTVVDPEKQENTAETAEPVDWEAPPAPADPVMAEKLADVEKKLAEAEKQRLLALAEMDNQRKRFAKELEALRYRVTQDTLFPFLQVLDHFTMAVKAAEAPGANADAILKGMSMISTEFDHAFTDLGVEKIDATGKKFDPNFHEAVAEEASDTVPAGVVIRQWSLGCKMGSRLFKPAMVVVSSGPAKAEEPEKEAEKK